MKLQKFLTINNRGSTRITQGKPHLNNNEIAIKLNINIPKQFFDRIVPVVDINIPDNVVLEPDVETIINMTANEVADKLKLDVNEVADGLRDMIENKEKGGEDNG